MLINIECFSLKTGVRYFKYDRKFQPCLVNIYPTSYRVRFDIKSFYSVCVCVGGGTHTYTQIEALG